MIPALSEREKQVLAAHCRGLCAKEIAQELDIALRTVETHKEHIAKKIMPCVHWTGISLFVRAIELGLTPCPCRVGATPESVRAKQLCEGFDALYLKFPPLSS